jgi:hypothetical protein
MSLSVFTPLGVSGVISYADDSTDAAVTVTAANGVQVFNADTGNIVVVNIGFNSLDHNAVVPTSGANGQGTVLGPRSQLTLNIPQAVNNSTMYISAAGVSGTGNVYFSLGTFANG